MAGKWYIFFCVLIILNNFFFIYKKDQFPPYLQYIQNYAFNKDSGGTGAPMMGQDVAGGGGGGGGGGNSGSYPPQGSYQAPNNNAWGSGATGNYDGKKY